MIRWLITCLAFALVIGGAGMSAQAALVAYDLVDVGDAGLQFTGSFTFDTVTDAISNEILQSSGGPTEAWLPTNGTTFNGGASYYGAPIATGFDLFFASSSALFPTSDGDIVGFSLFDPLDGVSGDGILGVYFVALSAPGAVPEVIGNNSAIQGCVAPVGVAIVVGQDPGAPTCALAGASVPEPSSLALLVAGLLGFSAALTARPRQWRRHCVDCSPDAAQAARNVRDLRECDVLVRLVTSLAALLIAAGPAAAGQFAFATIDDPLDTSGSSYVLGINDAGVVAGGYSDSGGTAHGFTAAAGSFTPIDDPSATSGTVVNAINNAGTVVGYYNTNAGLKSQGFVYSGGSFSNFDSPQALTPGATFPTGINNAGTIVGSFSGTDGFTHGFVDVGGTFTQIDAPGASLVLGGTNIYGINDAGTMTGSYNDASGNLHGFIDTGGVFTEITDPSAPTGCVGCGTLPVAINDAGAIVGIYFDASQLIFSFLDVGGIFSAIDDPSADFGATIVNDINDAGTIAGYYGDASGIHGFAGTPVEPVPEPASFAILAIGIAAIGMRRRGRR